MAEHDKDSSQEIVAILKEIRDDQRAWGKGSGPSTEMPSIAQAEFNRMHSEMLRPFTRIAIASAVLTVLVYCVLRASTG